MHFFAQVACHECKKSASLIPEAEGANFKDWSRVDMSLNWGRFQLTFQLQKTPLQLNIMELIFSRLFLGCKLRSSIFLPYWQLFLLSIIINEQGNFSIASTCLHEIHMCGLWVKHSCLQNDSCFLFRNLILDTKVY